MSLPIDFRAPALNQRRIEGKNVGESDIEPYSYLEVVDTEHTADGRTILHVQQPADASGEIDAFACELTIPVGLIGPVTQDLPTYVQYTGANPDPGDALIGMTGAYTVEKGGGRLIAIGDPTGELVRVQRRFTSSVEYLQFDNSTVYNDTDDTDNVPFNRLKHYLFRFYRKLGSPTWITHDNTEADVMGNGNFTVNESSLYWVSLTIRWNYDSSMSTYPRVNSLKCNGQWKRSGTWGTVFIMPTMLIYGDADWTTAGYFSSGDNDGTTCVVLLVPLEAGDKLRFQLYDIVGSGVLANATAKLVFQKAQALEDYVSI